MGNERVWSCLIDSAKRHVWDVNGWTLLFPRSGASGNAMARQPMTDSPAGGCPMKKTSSAPHQTHLHPLRKCRHFPPTAICRLPSGDPNCSGAADCLLLLILYKPLFQPLIIRHSFASGLQILCTNKKRKERKGGCETLLSCLGTLPLDFRDHYIFSIPILA